MLTFSLEEKPGDPHALAARLYDLAELKGLASAAHGYKTLYDDWPDLEDRIAAIIAQRAVGPAQASFPL